MSRYCRLYFDKWSEQAEIPQQKDFRRWVKLALEEYEAPTEITIRVVDEKASAALNAAHRGKNTPTNVLSFPTIAPETIKKHHKYLGDLVFCHTVINREAGEQGKPLDGHWAHLAIHGSLHLLGYDHVTDEDAQIMEAEEIRLLARLGYPNPYEVQE